MSLPQLTLSTQSSPPQLTPSTRTSPPQLTPSTQSNPPQLTPSTQSMSLPQQIAATAALQAGIVPSGSHTDLAVLFECPVCFDYVLPPIHQCDSGHLICTTCRPKLNNSCPSCRGPLGSVRNLAMEKVAETVKFPCKYASLGCTLRLLHNEKRTHEEVCEHRPYMCPCPGTSCKWQGPLDSVLDHLLTAHKTITTLNGEDIVFLATDINLPGSLQWLRREVLI